jgi:NMD protein affecting ribosome stability and mRNA decay
MISLCPMCGKEEVKKGLCIECFLKLHPPVKLKKFSLKRCNCGRYFYHGKWKSNLENTLEKIVKENLVIPREIVLKDMKVKTEFTKDGGEVLVELTFRGSYGSEDEEVSEREEKGTNSKHLKVKIEKIVCDVCKRQFRYYEAILQFRDFEPTKMKQIGSMVNREFVSDIQEVKKGLDFFITRRGYAKQIAKQFRSKKEEFQVKESEKLVGRTEDGKRKSRLTISIRKVEKVRIG